MSNRITAKKLPPAFIQDHVERGLPSPVWNKATSEWEGLREEWDELLEDAQHYSDVVVWMGGWQTGSGSAYLGLQSSARATAKAVSGLLAKVED